MSGLTRARVTLRFDDGYSDLYANAKPILDAANMVGTAMIITSRIGQAGTLSATELQALRNAGWDIGSHTRNHVILTDADEATQITELGGSRADLLALGISAVSFAPPSNGWNESLQSLAAAAGYTNVSTGYKGSPPYYLTWPPANPLNLLRSPSINSQAHSAATVLAWVDATIAAKAWQILVFHNIRDTADSLSTSITTFQAIASGLASRRAAGDLDVVTQAAGRQPPPADPPEPLAAPLGQVVLRGPTANHTLIRASLGDLTTETDLTTFRSPFGTQAHPVGTGLALPTRLTVSGAIERASREAATDALEELLAELPQINLLSVGAWFAPVEGVTGMVTCVPTLKGWRVSFDVVLDPGQGWASTS